MTREIRNQAGVFALLVVLCAVSRLLPHPPNFTPLASVSLFAGFLFRYRGLAAAAPLVAMAISDAVIGRYTPGVMIAVYASLLYPVALRGVLQRRLSPLRVVACAGSASLVFYAASNLAHWWFTYTYAHDWQGLVRCYWRALPFLKYTLAGDLLWSAALFSAYAAARAMARGAARHDPQPLPVHD